VAGGEWMVLIASPWRPRPVASPTRGRRG